MDSLYPGTRWIIKRAQKELRQDVCPKVRLPNIKCALDFPGKKANLHLVPLNDFG